MSGSMIPLQPGPGLISVFPDTIKSHTNGSGPSPEAMWGSEGHVTRVGSTELRGLHYHRCHGDIWTGLQLGAKSQSVAQLQGLC